MTPPDAPTLRPAAAADLDAARELFEAYPYKSVQRIVQRLERGRLIDFYAAGLKAALEAGTPHWLVQDARTPLALAALADDPWHSQVYGLRMGKVGPWLNTRRPRAAGRVLLDQIHQAARELNYEHLSVRVDGEDFLNLHLFEEDGWRLVDVSLKFSRPMAGGPRPVVQAPPGAEGWQVDLARPEDAAWIRHLGSTTHAATHYLNDPALDPEKTRALFAQWIERCIERLAYRIYTLRDGEGRGRGFVTYLRAPGFARQVGRAPLVLDFVLLDPAVRGGGLGPWLVDESLAREAPHGFDYCELRTSVHNLPAVNAYEKLGFRCCASDFVLHRRLAGTI